eukprot:10969736-Heterocapsa_arctica.AAC.1
MEAGDEIDVDDSEANEDESHVWTEEERRSFFNDWAEGEANDLDNYHSQYESYCMSGSESAELLLNSSSSHYSEQSECASDLLSSN